MRSIMRRATAAVVVAAVAAVAATAATAAKPKPKKAVVKVPASCNGLAYGHMGPLTGAAAALGQEQLHWDELALQQFNKLHRTNFQLVQGDTQLIPSQASTVAQSFAANPKILAVVGPAATSGVQVSGPIFAKTSLAMVSMSAVDSTLTNGSNPTFFRVNANNATQVPMVAELLLKKLAAKKVLIVNDAAANTAQLAEQLAALLKAKGVTVDSATVSQQATDFSSLIATIDAQTTAVVLTFQLATEGQLFAQQMAALGKHATIVGTNGLYSPTQFHPEGAYVASFAPDVRFYKGAQSAVDAYVKEFGASFGTYGPPTYVATQVVLNAMFRACSTGKKPTRAAVLAQVRKTDMKSSLLGTPVVFLKDGNSRYATFVLFHVKNGAYTPAPAK